MSGDSFCEYQDGEFDEEWDSYLDYIGMTEDRVNRDTLESFLALKGDDIPSRAATLMRSYVEAD